MKNAIHKVIKNDHIILAEDVNINEFENVKIGVHSEQELIPRNPEDFKELVGVDKEEFEKIMQSRCPSDHTGTLPRCPVLNLHKNMDRWAIYRMGVKPVAGNQFAYLAPKQFGGLTYIAHPGSYGDVWEIKTQQYGLVQIYAPKDNDSCRTVYIATGPNYPGDIPDGNYWGSTWCKRYYVNGHSNTP